jgi:hypothetical protein
MLFSFPGKGFGVAAIARLLVNDGYADVHASMRACVCVALPLMPSPLSNTKAGATQIRSTAIIPLDSEPANTSGTTCFYTSCICSQIGLRCVPALWLLPDASCGATATFPLGSRHAAWRTVAKSTEHSRWELVRNVVP